MKPIISLLVATFAIIPMLQTKAFSAPLYEESGHRNTTYVVATIAGLGNDVADRLAYFSQMPDEKWFRYSAPSVAIWGVVWPPYRHRIMNTLHSLHGGDNDAVLDRRGKLHELIASYDKDDSSMHWKIGFIIHAYGDSYAHVRPAATGIEAYGELVGHGFDCSVYPDYIGCHLENYFDYVRNLYSALGGKLGNAPKLEEYIQAIREIASQTSDRELREELIKEKIKDYLNTPTKEPQDMPKWNREMTPVNAFLKEIASELKY